MSAPPSLPPCAPPPELGIISRYLFIYYIYPPLDLNIINLSLVSLEWKNQRGCADLGAEIVFSTPLRPTIKKKHFPPKLAGLAEGERIVFCAAQGRAPKVNP